MIEEKRAILNSNDWRYYNHALISVRPPHEVPNVSALQHKFVWKSVGRGHAVLARWTTDFDCHETSNWWYVIKDTPFDIDALKAKRRYEITKGDKNFDVHIINPCDYKNELYEVQVAAFSAYPEKYRPKVDGAKFLESVNEWDKYCVFGAFLKSTGEMCGYSILEELSNDYVKFSVQKTKPDYERYGLNAALVHGMLKHYADLLEKGGYICDGERSINHETAFQDYLEKYFGFRKSYCKLNIMYRPGLRGIIKVLYLFRKVLLCFDEIGMVHNVNAVLRMEEAVRQRNVSK